jgi:heat-inducible transcriptional repressor
MACTFTRSQRIVNLPVAVYSYEMISELNERSREIFRFIVDTYLETGQPVGSRTIAHAARLALSPASIRNYMADLEALGLLYAPHTSAGRLPTEHGLRLYVDGLMEMGGLSTEERQKIEISCAAKGRPITEVLDKATTLLSGLSSCASLVIAPKTTHAIKQIQFVQLDLRKILIVLVLENGIVENRMMDMPSDVPAHALIAATNYLNSKLAGRTLESIKDDISADIRSHKTQLDSITQGLIERGLALQSPQSDGYILVRGQSKLLEDVRALEELERARILLGYLEEKKSMLTLLDNVAGADGVKIFIGTENKIFDQSGWSMIISPYRNAKQNIVGAIGVIGPTRLNYDRIIPMVDYTSRIMGRVLDDL